MTNEINKMLTKRFGKDSLIALATINNNIPYNRIVNAYYEDGSFYIITYLLSNKMQHILKNPKVGLAGEWFTGHGTATNIGWFRKKENQDIALKLKKVFSSWIDNGHNNFNDENTIILKIEINDGILIANDKKYKF